MIDSTRQTTVAYQADWDSGAVPRGCRSSNSLNSLCSPWLLRMTSRGGQLQRIHSHWSPELIVCNGQNFNPSADQPVHHARPDGDTPHIAVHGYVLGQLHRNGRTTAATTRSVRVQLPIAQAD